MSLIKLNFPLYAHVSIIFGLDFTFGVSFKVCSRNRNTPIPGIGVARSLVDSEITPAILGTINFMTDF